MKTFETDIFTMTVDSHAYVEMKVKKDASFDVKELVETKNYLTAHLPGKKFYVLFNGEDYFHVNKETREFGASKEYSDHLAAMELFSNNLALKLVGNFFIGINKPVVPTKFFSDKKKAEEWLKDRMKG